MRQVSSSRTALAALLVAIAVAVPGAAWYLVGTREAAREAEALEAETRHQASEASRRLADRLATRLESLRAAESERPYYHYQSLYHDPGGASEGVSILPSPLSERTADPLIRAHFQIDADGTLTLPTLNDAVAEIATKDEASSWRAIRAQLEPVAPSFLRAAREAAGGDTRTVRMASSMGMAPEPGRGAAPATQAAPRRTQAVPSRANSAPAARQQIANAPVDAGNDVPQASAAPEQQLMGAQAQQANVAPAQQINAASAQQASMAPAQQLNVAPAQQGIATPAQQLMRAQARQGDLPPVRQAVQPPAQALEPITQAQAARSSAAQANAAPDLPTGQPNAEANPAPAQAYDPVAQAAIDPGALAANAAPGAQAANAFPFGLEEPSRKNAAPDDLGYRMKKAAPPRKVVKSLEPDAYAQNAMATELFTNLKRSKQRRTTAPPPLPQLPQPTGEVQIELADFTWHTMTVAGAPALVALREVTLPSGRLVQGMLFPREGLQAWLEGLKEAAMPVRLEPGTATRAAGMATEVALDGVAWRIEVDAAETDGVARAREVRSRFRGTFAAGFLFAALAGLGVVGMVWQSERLAKQRSRFAASAAHELRTPLAGMRIYAEMLSEGLGDPNKSKEYARRVAGEAERLGRVVSNVLEFTRLERGTLAVKPQTGDLLEAVALCVARQLPALEAAGAKVETRFPEVLPPVRFDRDAVAHIVQNLLDNAEKYSREAADRSIEVSLEDTPTGVALSVADRGPGLPKQVRRRLFRPFARGGEADAPAGLGLGLALVQVLARAHGGAVRYADRPGGGSIFTVVLPAESLDTP